MDEHKVCYGWPGGDARLDGQYWVGPASRPRIVRMHFDYGYRAFCGAKSGLMTDIEEKVTCLRCQHRIGLRGLADGNG